MNDYHDDERVMRSLLAQAADEPADEAFVASVSRRVAWHRLAGRVAQGAAVLAFVLAALALAPVVLPLVAWVAEAPAAYAPAVEARLFSPVGLALSAAAAAVALARLVALR